jgi:phytoene dehydrogenase-like protein
MYYCGNTNHLASRKLQAAPHFGQISAPLKAEWKSGFAAAQAGKLPGNCGVSFISKHPRPQCGSGRQHTMSVFARYVPYEFANGNWDAIAKRSAVLRSIVGQVLRNIGCSQDAQVLGPPDIEKKVGLTGGHIFQGECLPPYMWSRRLSPRTPCPVSVVRACASRWQRDCHQRQKCSHGSAEGRGSQGLNDNRPSDEDRRRFPSPPAQ